jgi:hypothetical protein
MTADERTIINQLHVITVEVRKMEPLLYHVTAIVDVCGQPHTFVIKEEETEAEALEFLKLFHTQSNLFEAHGLEGSMINLDDLELVEGKDEEENPIWQELLKDLPDIDN